jgi:hypothetical protein
MLLTAPLVGGSTYLRTETDAQASKLYALMGQYVSQPLAANASLNLGTIVGYIPCYESSSSMNACPTCIIRLVSKDGATVRGTLLSYIPTSTANEYATSTSYYTRAHPPSAAASALTVTEGDRIVVEVGTFWNNTVSTSYNSRMYLGSNSTQSDAPTGATSVATTTNPWVEFPNVPVFYGNVACTNTLTLSVTAALDMVRTIAADVNMTLSVTADLDVVAPPPRTIVAGRTRVNRTPVVRGGIDTYVTAMTHFDGVDASTTFTDETGKTWTQAGTAQIDTSQSKFGSASLLLDGNSDYITTPDHDDFNLGSGDFTIDCWIRTPSLAGAWRSIISQKDSGVSNYAFDLIYGYWGILTFKYTTNGTTETEGALTYIDFTVDTWYHIAVVRSGATMYMFINGVITDTYDIGSATIYNSTAAVAIGATKDGASYTGFFSGWIDEMRISKGIARWTANFTPLDRQYS